MVTGHCERASPSPLCHAKSFSLLVSSRLLRKSKVFGTWMPVPWIKSVSPGCPDPAPACRRSILDLLERAPKSNSFSHIIASLGRGCRWFDNFGRAQLRYPQSKEVHASYRGRHRSHDSCKGRGMCGVHFHPSFLLVGVRKTFLVIFFLSELANYT